MILMTNLLWLWKTFTLRDQELKWKFHHWASQSWLSRGRHHSPDEVRGGITALKKAGALLQPWPPTPEQSAWACLLHIKRRVAAHRWSIVIAVKCNLGWSLGPEKWGVGWIYHLHSYFMEFVSPGKGERGRHRWLLNLHNIRRVVLHGKKQNHNRSSPSAIKLTNVPELPIIALMHLQR